MVLAFLKSLPRYIATAIIWGIFLLSASLLAALAGAVAGGCLGLVAEVVEAINASATPRDYVTLGMVTGLKIGGGLGFLGTIYLCILGSCEFPSAVESHIEVGPPR